MPVAVSSPSLQQYTAIQSTPYMQQQHVAVSAGSMTMSAPPPIPNPCELNIPGGTYTATQTFVQVDRTGQWFATSMSAQDIVSKKFAIHLWYRKSLMAPWELIQHYEDAHGQIDVIGDDLYFVVNRPNKTTFMNKIERWAGVR